MTRGHGWSLPFTMRRTFTSYSLPAFTGAFYDVIKLGRKRVSRSQIRNFCPRCARTPHPLGGSPVSQGQASGP